VKDVVDVFVAVDDNQTVAAMRMLARPMPPDPAIEAGPSGACGLASLVAVMRDETMRPVRDAITLGSSSRVVVINTEGATDRELYDRIVSL
jgi:diaminopropionate ammonia-lyase